MVQLSHKILYLFINFFCDFLIDLYLTGLFYFIFIYYFFFRKSVNLTLRRTRKFIPPTVVRGGGRWMEPLPGVFDMLQYFETILPLVESFWSS